jgi:hypothetical protein
VQHRHVDVARAAAEVQRGPVVVVGGVRQEVAQVGGAGGEAVGPVEHRGVLHGLAGERGEASAGHARPRVPLGDQLRPDLLPGQRADPVHRPVQLQDAVAVEAVVEERDRAGDGARRPQRRRPVGGEVVLREAHVALRQRADLPVAPRQLGGPGHGVGAVGSLLRERVERAVGRAAAPHVLDHHDVAVVGEVRGLDALRGPLAVGRADQQHRVAPGLRGAVDVGAQDDAVAGGHLDVELRLGHAVSLSGCAASRCRRSSSRRGGNPPA